MQQQTTTDSYFCDNYLEDREYKLSNDAESYAHDKDDSGTDKQPDTTLAMDQLDSTSAQNFFVHVFVALIRAAMVDTDGLFPATASL